jgi:hypothetical protein
MATTIFQTGFEPSTYTAGTLAGQDGWLNTIGTPSTNITVQSSTVSTGTQAVQFVGSGTSAFLRDVHPVIYDTKTPGADGIVTFSEDARLSAVPGGGTASGWDLLIVFEGQAVGNTTCPCPALAWLSINPSTGHLTVNEIGEVSPFDTGVVFARGVWNRLELDLNFGTDTLSALYNGTLVASNISFPTTPFGNTVRAGFETTTNNAAANTDTAFFDNFVASTVPEPAAASLVALAFVFFAMRRRARS